MKKVTVHRPPAPTLTTTFLRRGGQPLDPALRHTFETRFEHDFSKVRVYHDDEAARAAASVNASAFAIGQAVVFGSNYYRPETADGQRLIAHELVHTIQNGSRVINPLTISKPTDGREVEAANLADGYLRGSDNLRPREFATGSRAADVCRQVKDTDKKPKILAQAHGGQLVVRKFDTYYERLGPDEGLQAIDCEFAFVRNADSEYGDPSRLNWFQTVQTNYETNSLEVPPESTEITEFVDGDGPVITPGNRDEARFWSKTSGSTLSDTLHRRSLPDREVLWKAHTSLIGISEKGLEILATVEWGFTMTRTGGSKVIHVKHIDTPSTYHQKKFQELRVKEE